METFQSWGCPSVHLIEGCWGIDSQCLLYIYIYIMYVYIYIIYNVYIYIHILCICSGNLAKILALQLPAFGSFSCSYSDALVAPYVSSVRWALRSNATCMNWRGPCCNELPKITLFFCRFWQGWADTLLCEHIRPVHKGIKIFSQLAAMQQIAVLPWKF